MTKKESLVSIVIGLLVLLGLQLTSVYNYLLFHSLVEIFSIVVACGIFMLAWNTRRFVENTYLLFLGIAYLFVGGLDLIHTLAYTGMGIFEGYGTNLPTQLWVGARYVESLSLLIASLLLGRKLKVNVVVLGYVSVTSLLLASIFYWNLFPACFIEGTGLTPFKKISEYVISLILLASIPILLEKRPELHASILRLLIASIALTILSELAFTLYAHAYGLANMIGHYLKIVSFYLIYKALIETGLARPYALLFKNLKESEERFRQLSENVQDAFWLGTAGDGGRGEILYVNPAFEEIFGIKAEEIYKSDNAWLEILHEDDRDRVLEAQEEFVHGRGEYDVEYRIVRDGDEVRWIWAKGFPIRDERGEIVRTAGIAHDITNRKRTEDELRKLSRAVEQSPATVMITDAEGTIEYVNPKFVQITGYSPAEAIGQNPRILNSGEQPVEFYRDLWETITRGQQWRGEFYNKKKNGDLYWEFASISPIKNEEGIITHFVGVKEDITDRKRAEAQIIRAKQEWERTFDAVPDLIMILDTEYRVLRVNKAMSDKLSCTPKDLVGMICYDVFHGAEKPTGHCPHAQLMADGLEHSAEVHEDRLGGDFLVSVNPLHDPEGKLAGSVHVARDITVRKQAEEALRRAHDELEQRVEERTAELSKANKLLKQEIGERERAEEALRESENQLRHLSSQLLSAQEKERKKVAQDLHDSIGQTLAAIKFGTENVLRHIPKKASKKIRQPLEAAISMVQSAIEEVRRIQTELRPPTLDDLGILATLSWFCREFQSIYSGIRIEQHIDIQEDDVRVPLKTTMYRVMQEALNNVAKHSKANQVRLSLKKEEGTIELAIEDNGLGFDLDDVLSVESSKRGLGISSMKERTELSGGSFTIESATEAGTIIRAAWPERSQIEDGAPLSESSLNS